MGETLNKKRGLLALVIIDGWGYSPTREANAIALAAKPFYDELSEKYPRTLLTAHGARVGLPDGVMGNSEVGHLNLGAGRVIRMDVSRIDHDIATGDFFSNEVLAKAMDGNLQRPRRHVQPLRDFTVRNLAPLLDQEDFHVLESLRFAGGHEFRLQTVEDLFQQSHGPAPLEDLFGRLLIGQFGEVTVLRIRLIQRKDFLAAAAFQAMGPGPLRDDEAFERDQ